MRYELLGPLRLVDEETRTVSAPKVETLLATLLIRANQPVSTDELLDELWGGEPPKRARAALHVYVSQLRKNFVQPAVEGAAIRTHAQGYLLEVDGASVDVFHLHALHTRGRSEIGHAPERALENFTAAARLFRGPVLGGIDNGLIVGTFTRWAEEVRLECLEAIAMCSLRLGRHRELIGDLSKWVEEYPLNENLREQLMLALYRAGRRADALEVFRSARRVLREELGLDPRMTMRRLQVAILASDADLAIAG
ncbi:BTAD domain-containing putative transcriptional regulator [Streptosporangium sp. NPDC001559]|uniref:AfsR/SARP family transcriptional regulator n=1 Tax=Streptosporangium sp. NPDC001559 TaxID=3366187 RepID=UPI0036E0DC2B